MEQNERLERLGNVLANPNWGNSVAGAVALGLLAVAPYAISFSRYLRPPVFVAPDSSSAVQTEYLAAN